MATMATGVADAIVDDVTGKICATRSADDLADALEVLLCDDEKRIAMGRAAAQRASVHFPNTKVWANLADVYERRGRRIAT